MKLSNYPLKMWQSYGNDSNKSNYIHEDGTNYSFACFIWVWNLVSHQNTRIQIETTSEENSQGEYLDL
jgi:hypothetical protein